MRRTTEAVIKEMPSAPSRCLRLRPPTPSFASETSESFAPFPPSEPALPAPPPPRARGRPPRALCCGSGCSGGPSDRCEAGDAPVADPEEGDRNFSSVMSAACTPRVNITSRRHRTATARTATQQIRGQKAKAGDLTDFAQPVSQLSRIASLRPTAAPATGAIEGRASAVHEKSITRFQVAFVASG
jgi:hypothetical protein